MPNDPYYRTPAWRALRSAALRRDGNICVVPGCGAPARTVDHIKRRQDGGADALHNLRSLCIEHDNQVKEFRGKRRNVEFRVKGSTNDGRPRDPQHPWNF